MTTSSPLGLIDFSIPGESLVPGKYQAQVYRQGSRDTITQVFEVIWDNMPLSLRNSKYAAESMFYILTDQEYEKILKGSENDIKAKIFAYWRTKDPSPQTSFNEALAEYFNRVDYAFFNFQTIEDRDGSKTERGKVYMTAYPGATGWLFFLACVAVVFLAGGKLLDAVRPQPELTPAIPPVSASRRRTISRNRPRSFHRNGGSASRPSLRRN